MDGVTHVRSTIDPLRLSNVCELSLFRRQSPSPSVHSSNSFPLASIAEDFRDQALKSLTISADSEHRPLTKLSPIASSADSESAKFQLGGR